ncbi:unnamed protein product [Dracunculus medinensis]|uniref:Ribosome biogenesis protein NOP53 n=1 Tax=Dracunculus medinensis TaxID=318479 RepID=A0A0N4UCA2_DRAME|nr:unnamed protein product [Dracunculus medinensis]
MRRKTGKKIGRKGQKQIGQGMGEKNKGKTKENVSKQRQKMEKLMGNGADKRARQDNENDENAGKDTAGRAKALALTAGGITFGVQKLLGTSEDARTVGSNDPHQKQIIANIRFLKDSREVESIPPLNALILQEHAPSRKSATKVLRKETQNLPEQTINAPKLQSKTEISRQQEVSENIEIMPQQKIKISRMLKEDGIKSKKMKRAAVMEQSKMMNLTALAHIKGVFFKKNRFGAKFFAPNDQLTPDESELVEHSDESEEEE